MKKLINFLAACALLPLLHAENSEYNAKRYQIKPSCNLVIQKGDITKAHVDVIVNAANPQLQAGGGVCGAIFAAAGHDALQQACNNFPLTRNERCAVGHVVLTESFNLKDQGINHIIHAVGPDYRVNYSWWKSHDWIQRKYLSDTYQNALLAANSVGASSIAFPFISSGISAFPQKDACKIALHTVISFAQQNTNNQLREIHFVVYNDDDYELFCQIAHWYAIYPKFVTIENIKEIL